MAQRNILCAAHLRNGDALAFQIAHIGDANAVTGHQNRAPAARARNDFDFRAVGLQVGIDGGAGADVADVYLARKQRFHRFRPRVEDFGIERNLPAQCLLKRAASHAQHGGRMGDVGEIAQAQTLRAGTWHVGGRPTTNASRNNVTMPKIGMALLLAACIPACK